MSDRFTRKEIYFVLSGLCARGGVLWLVWWASDNSETAGRLDFRAMFIGAMAWSAGASAHTKTEQRRGE